MLDFALENTYIITNISYAGEGVVLVSIYDKTAGTYDMMPFYFQTKAQAYEYIIKFTNQLLEEQKFKIVEEE